jgi:hypothetical protein
MYQFCADSSHQDLGRTQQENSLAALGRVCAVAAKDAERAGRHYAVGCASVPEDASHGAAGVRQAVCCEQAVDHEDELRGLKIQGEI